MRIGLISSVWISIPPKNFGFGAQEYLEYYIAQGLTQRGHDVTVFASGDSKVSGRLVSVVPKQVIDLPYPDAPVKMHFELLNAYKAFTSAREFDIFHNHLLPYGLFFTNLVKTPTIHTLHHEIHAERSDSVIYHHFKSQPFISISNTQRLTFPDLNYIRTVYNGIDTNYYLPSAKPKENYLLYLGRMKRYKGIHTAIAIAKDLDLPLKIVAPLPIRTQPDYRETNEYWEKDIKPFIGGNIEFIDSLGGKDKVRILQRAKALLFPVRREEPFGMTATEAMACGTPVIAYAMGAIPEIVVDGRTGFLVNRPSRERGRWHVHQDGAAGLMEAVTRLYSLSKDEYRTMATQARERVVNHFSVEKMVDDYEDAYKQVIGRKR